MLLIVSCIFVSPLYAFDDWTRTDYMLEGLCLGLKMVDWGQTLNIADETEHYDEINPAIGRNPSRSNVNRYFLISSLAHVCGSIILPTRFKAFGYTLNPRRAWQYVFICGSASLVVHNYQVGLHVRF